MVIDLTVLPHVLRDYVTHTGAGGRDTHFSTPESCSCSFYTFHFRAWCWSALRHKSFELLYHMYGIFATARYISVACSNWSNAHNVNRQWKFSDMYAHRVIELQIIIKRPEIWQFFHIFLNVGSLLKWALCVTVRRRMSKLRPVIT